MSLSEKCTERALSRTGCMLFLQCPRCCSRPVQPMCDLQAKVYLTAISLNMANHRDTVSHNSQKGSTIVVYMCVMLAVSFTSGMMLPHMHVGRLEAGH